MTMYRQSISRIFRTMLYSVKLTIKMICGNELLRRILSRRVQYYYKKLLVKLISIPCVRLRL